MDKIKEFGTMNFRKKIAPIAVGLTLIVLTVSGCNSQFSSTNRQASDQAQTTLSPLGTSDQAQPSTKLSNEQSSSPSDLTQSNKKQPSPTQSQTEKVTAKSTTNVVETNAELTQELKTFLKDNYGTAPHEDSWYHYITDITITGNNTTVKTSLNSDKHVANSIANAVHSWSKFNGIAVVKSRSGSILAQESKK